MRGLDRITTSIHRAWQARPALPRWTINTGAFAAGAGVGLVAVVFLTLELAAPVLPFKTDLYSLNRPAAYTFLDEKGDVVGRRGAAVGERLSLSELPPHVPAAFLVMEDRRFYQHNGIDFRGLARAAVADIKAKRFVQGGSTITQQLVKLLFLTPDRTIMRKIVEMAGARELESVLTKAQILELYLNRIYLGAGAYGVDGAARAYFGKSARELTLAEATMLAGLTNAPSLYSPRRDLKAAQQRSAMVLRLLATHGGWNAKEIEQALANPATLVTDTSNPERNYFLDAAVEEAKALTTDKAGDLTIVTTIDVNAQKAASTAIENVMTKRGPSAQAQEAALVAMRPDGAVRALIGGRDYAQSTFNRATKALRSPGSAFKPFVYLTALEQGYARDMIRYDEPITVGDWSPANFDGRFAGPMSLQAALVRSINTVAVGLGQELGLPSVISTAQRLGIRSDLAPNASLALGTSEVTPLELTAAYATFASLGLQAAPYTVTEIRASDGAILYQRRPQPPRRVIDTETSLAMNAMLYEVVKSGTGRGAALKGREIAGKTGTGTDHRDAWFVGYSAELVAGVWVGNDDYTPMKRVTGGALPAQIWSGFMQAALKGVRPTPLPRAEPIIEPLLVAEVDEDEDGFFDRVGNFFDRLFAPPSRPRAPEATRPLAPPPPQPRVSDDGRETQRYAYQREDAYRAPDVPPTPAPPPPPRVSENSPNTQRYAYQQDAYRAPEAPTPSAPPQPRMSDDGRETQRYPYQRDDIYPSPDATPTPAPRPQARVREDWSGTQRYGYQREDAYPPPRAPEPRVGDDWRERERYAYQQDDRYPAPRRPRDYDTAYPYGPPPGYGYPPAPPRYGYAYGSGRYDERRRDREPRYFNRRYQDY